MPDVGLEPPEVRITLGALLLAPRTESLVTRFASARRIICRVGDQVVSTGTEKCAGIRKRKVHRQGARLSGAEVRP
jgi:hypothetical protein